MRKSEAYSPRHTALESALESALEAIEIATSKLERALDDLTGAVWALVRAHRRDP